MKVSVEEMNDKTVIRGNGVHIEVLSDGCLLIDTNNPVMFKGSTLKKFECLTSSMVNTVLSILGAR